MRVTRFSIIFSTILLRRDMIGRFRKFSVDDDADVDLGDDVSGSAMVNPNPWGTSSLCVKNEIEIERKV
ncbi:hypothetical protein Tco_0042286, partial [Tanacetum coccineum]